MESPNDTWCVDYKGEFKTGDGVYCYPLTVTDGCNRLLIGCQGLLSTALPDGERGIRGGEVALFGFRVDECAVPASRPSQ